MPADWMVNMDEDFENVEEIEEILIEILENEIESYCWGWLWKK